MLKGCRPGQRTGVIDVLGGRLRIVNRPLLESCSCERYMAVRSLYDKLLPANL